jgi:hypothetical protein
MNKKIEILCPEYLLTAFLLILPLSHLGLASLLAIFGSREALSLFKVCYILSYQLSCG